MTGAGRRTTGLTPSALELTNGVSTSVEFPSALPVVSQPSVPLTWVTAPGVPTEIAAGQDQSLHGELKERLFRCGASEPLFPLC